MEYLPPIDIVIGLVCIGVFGVILGALIYLPIADKDSPLALEKLSGDIIWRYLPDWILSFIGCIIFITLSFMLITGFMRGD
ncbi:MAG: hypothetical protein IJU71_05500 [Selenomonadaceae bacterium]|nr:hypothetical protein [Selenomonadaceae bacterium]